MKKKHLLQSLLAVGLVATILTGCGNAAATDAGTDAETPETTVQEEATEETAEETEAASDETADETPTEVTTIKAATSGTTNPYTTIGDDGENTGYDIEVLKAVFDRLPQYNLEFVTTDFGSIFEGTLSGSYDIAVNNFSYNEKRSESYLYSYPYDEISYVWVTKKGDDSINSFETAAGKNTVVSSGVSITLAEEKWNEENPDKQHNLTYSEQETPVTLQQIADGSVDYAIIDFAMFVAYQDIYEFDIQATDVSPEDTARIAENNYAYYLFAYDHAQLRDEVSAVLKELKEDGTLAAIGEEWFGRDTSPDDSQFEKTLN